MKLEELNKDALTFFSCVDPFLDSLYQEFFGNHLIQGMAYIEFLDDVHYLMFNSNNDLTRYFVSEVTDNGYFKNVVTQVTDHAPYFHVYNCVGQKDPMLTHYYKSYNMGSGFTLYWRDEGKLKVVSFYMSCMTDFSVANNYYLNNKTPLAQIAKEISKRISLYIQSGPVIRRARFTDSSFTISYKGKLETDVKSNGFFKYENTLEKLSSRQKTCLLQLVYGKSYKEIACFIKEKENLEDYSPRTVEGHINALKQKFQCSSKAELIKNAYDYGLLGF